MHLNGVSHIDAKTAEALVLNANNKALYLQGLTSVDDDTAKALAHTRDRYIVSIVHQNIDTRTVDLFYVLVWKCTGFGFGVVKC